MIKRDYRGAIKINVIHSNTLHYIKGVFVCRDSKEFDKVLADQKHHEADALERLRELSQLDMDKAILALEKKHQEQIEKLKAQIELIKERKQSEVDKYQQRYLELLEQFKNQAINAETVED